MSIGIWTGSASWCVTVSSRSVFQKHLFNSFIALFLTHHDVEVYLVLDVARVVHDLMAGHQGLGLSSHFWRPLRFELVSLMSANSACNMYQSHSGDQSSKCMHRPVSCFHQCNRFKFMINAMNSGTKHALACSCCDMETRGYTSEKSNAECAL